MTSALRTVISALGVCAACYMLATASWQQVLMLFSVASIGWCLFAFMAETHGTPAPVNRAPNTRPRGKRESKAAASFKTAKSAPRPAFNQTATVVQPRPERIQRVYRFPMHELARASFTPVTD